MKYIAEVDGLEFPVEIMDEHHICFGGEILEVDLAAVSGQPLYSLIVNGESFEGYVYPDEQSWQVLLLGRSYSISIEDEREKRLRAIDTGCRQPGSRIHSKSPHARTGSCRANRRRSKSGKRTNSGYFRIDENAK